MLRSQPYTTALEKRSLGKRAYKSLIETSCSNRISGGYCGGVPPLPIPNREVKPTSADGTAMQCGRVGNRLLLEESSETKVLGLSFFVIWLVERRRGWRGRMWGGSTRLNGLFMGIAVDCSRSEKEELLIPYTGSADFRVEVDRCAI